MDGMTPRKRVANDRPWPGNWTVEFEWEFNGTTLKSRLHDFQIEGSTQWFTFDRHVTNDDTGATWIDGFAQYPYGAFVSYRPERVVKVRRHVTPNKRKTGDGKPNSK